MTTKPPSKDLAPVGEEKPQETSVQASLKRARDSTLDSTLYWLVALAAVIAVWQWVYDHLALAAVAGLAGLLLLVARWIRWLIRNFCEWMKKQVLLEIQCAAANLQARCPIPTAVRDLDGAIANVTMALIAENFSRLCEFDGRVPRIVYTCRSSVEDSRCPNQTCRYPISRTTGWPLAKAFCTHIAVDELVTANAMLSWYSSRVRALSESERLRCTPVCSSLPAEARRRNGDSKWNEYASPELCNSDLILIGENVVSHWYLKLMEPFLNFRFNVVQETKPNESSRYVVQVDYHPLFDYIVDISDNLRPHWENKRENAVAAAFLFPASL